MACKRIKTRTRFEPRAPCDVVVVLYQMSQQANWELVIMLVRNTPVR